MPDPNERETHDLVWHIGCWGCTQHWSAGGGSGCRTNLKLERETDYGLLCETRTPHHWAPSNAERDERERFARRTTSYPPWTEGKRAASKTGEHYLEPVPALPSRDNVQER